MMKVLNTNGWMYAIELEEPGASRPGKYYVGTKIRGVISEDLAQAMSTMSIPEVPKGSNVPIPDEIQEAIKRTAEDQESALQGRLAESQMHEHISERHSERLAVWPRIAQRVREILKHGRDDGTASIDEIYGRYL